MYCCQMLVEHNLVKTAECRKCLFVVGSKYWFECCYKYKCVNVTHAVPSEVGELKLTQRSPLFLKVAWTPPDGDLTHYQLNICSSDGDVLQTISIGK